MNFDDLKDQLRERFQVLAARVQESAAWGDLTEKFGNLSPNAQKGVLAGIGAFFALVLLAIPYSMYSSSATTVTEFEEKRDLIRELFRVKRESAILDSAPPEISPAELQSRANNQITTAQIQPEQIRSISEFDNAGSPGIPKNVIQKGITVNLGKLTLRQVVDLGHQLQSIHPSTKMIGLEVNANRDNPHYFDVVYKIVSFSLPAEPPPKAPAGRNKRPSRPAAAGSGSGD